MKDSWKNIIFIQKEFSPSCSLKIHLGRYLVLSHEKHKTSLCVDYVLEILQTYLQCAVLSDFPQVKENNKYLPTHTFTPHPPDMDKSSHGFAISRTFEKIFYHITLCHINKANKEWL